MTMYEQEDIIEATHLLMREEDKTVEGEVLIGIMASGRVIGREDAMNLAHDMYRRSVTGVIRPVIGQFYMLPNADDQQWTVTMSMGRYSVTCLCGFGDDGKVYLAADVPKEARERAEALLTPAAA